MDYGQLLLYPSDQHVAELKVTLSIEEPMGSDTLWWGTLAGETFSLRTGSDQAPVLDEETEIFIDMSQASIFDEAGERL